MQKISPEIIPHKKFHERIWLLPLKRPTWYYFIKKKNNNAIKNPDFIKSVDDPLKELVTFLHSRGIKTTPSCSGHNKSKKQFMEIYRNLEKDRDEARSKGLALKDIESGKLYSYKDPDYKLPWTRKMFINKITQTQEKGVMGLRFKNPTRKKQILQLQIPQTNIRERDSIVFIFTNDRKAWKKITGKIKDILS